MATNNNNIVLQPQITKLNGRNYHFWSIQMRVLFESQDLWSVIDIGVPEVTGDQTSLTQEQKEVRKRDKKALFLIFQAVEEPVFERISTATSSRNAWEILQRCYRGEERVKTIRLQTLRCEFDNFKMKDSETVEEFYNRIVALVNQIRINGEAIEERRVVEKILRSLTRQFEYVVVAIEETKDLSTFSLESLLGTLQSHEMRLKQFDSPSIDHAFKSQLHFKPTDEDMQNDSWKNTGKQKVHWEDQSADPKENRRVEGTSKNQEFSDKPRIPLRKKKCYYCQRLGHVMKYCWKKKEDEEEQDHGNAKFMEESKDTMFMVCGDGKECLNDDEFDVVQEDLHDILF